MQAIPWQDIFFDLVCGLPYSEGYSSILVIAEWFSKMVYLTPLGKYTSVSSLPYRLFREVICLHSLPSTIISDCNP